MRETSVTQEVLHFGVFLIIGASVALAGWNEPLRYLFMKQEHIAAEERAMFVVPDDGADARRPFGSSFRGTALDRAPYRTGKGGSIEYSSNFDNRRMGPRTETDRKEHSYGGRR